MYSALTVLYVPYWEAPPARQMPRVPAPALPRDPNHQTLDPKSSTLGACTIGGTTYRVHGYLADKKQLPL